MDKKSIIYISEKSFKTESYHPLLDKDVLPQIFLVKTQKKIFLIFFKEKRWLLPKNALFCSYLIKTKVTYDSPKLSFKEFLGKTLNICRNTINDLKKEIFVE